MLHVVGEMGRVTATEGSIIPAASCPLTFEKALDFLLAVETPEVGPGTRLDNVFPGLSTLQGPLPEGKGAALFRTDRINRTSTSILPKDTGLVGFLNQTQA